MDNETKQNQLNYGDFLRTIDISIASQGKSGHINSSEIIKEELTQTLLEQAKARGEGLLPETIDNAIKSYMAKEFSFESTIRNKKPLGANVYVHRGKIFKQFILPLTITAGIVLSGVQLTEFTNKKRLEQKEISVENNVESAYLLSESLNDEITKMEMNNKNISPIPGLAKEGKALLEKNRPFFKQFCSNGTADDDINPENYELVDKQLLFVVNDLSDANQKINFMKETVGVRQDLDYLIKNIRVRTTENAFLQKAELIYKQGMQNLEQKALEQAKTNEKELQTIQNNISVFSDLKSQLEVLHQSVNNIAKEQEAKRIANDSYTLGTKSVETFNTNDLKTSVSELKTLESSLKQQYTLRIVSKPGIKSGVERTYSDEHGRRVSGIYLVVEAIDKNSGAAIPMKIKNEETGQVDEVRMWAERVPQIFYEAVKRDKLDDGIIQNSALGTKEQGYMNPTITFKTPDDQKLKLSGQITRW
ncbi:MAG: hypothetical protein KKB65_03445 [Nanoarchaeota archaeon]|nr:hypothetical protein [Nanoarchaeota archaeon]